MSYDEFLEFATDIHAEGIMEKPSFHATENYSPPT